MHLNEKDTASKHCIDVPGPSDRIQRARVQATSKNRLKAEFVPKEVGKFNAIIAVKCICVFHRNTKVISS